MWSVLDAGISNNASLAHNKSMLQQSDEEEERKRARREAAKGKNFIGNAVTKKMGIS
jgi:hypothetical protein